MIPTSEVPEAELNYPAWILEFLYAEYREIYEDLIYRRTPNWLKPCESEDIMDDSIIQKLFLWATPSFFAFSSGFIQIVDSIMRSDEPVIHLGSLFNSSVSFFLNFCSL